MRSPTAATAAGFTLVESLVALLVLSVGMLGIAVVHGHALAASRTAIHRSLAVSLAADMADQIRANARALAAYEGEPADLRCDQPTRAAGISCSPEQMAAYELFVWDSLLAQALPGGHGSIEVDAAVTPPACRISVTWHDPASAAPLDLDIDIRLPGF